MKIFFLVFILGLPSFVYANETLPWNEGTLSSVNVGVRYSSSLNKRGATFYDYFQLDPVLGIFFFDDRLEFLGDSIGYRDFVYGDTLRLRGRLIAISDDPLFPKRTERLGLTNSRDNTYEMVVSLEWFLPRYDSAYMAEVDLNVHQDLNAHRGQYLELVGKKKLWSFREPWGQMLIEPNFVTSLGFGSRSHNKYFYGNDSGGAGLTSFSAGLQLALPETADRFFPIVLLQYYSVLGGARKGDLVKSNTSGVMLQFIATFGLLD